MSERYIHFTTWKNSNDKVFVYEDKELIAIQCYDDIESLFEGFHKSYAKNDYYPKSIRIIATSEANWDSYKQLIQEDHYGNEIYNYQSSISKADAYLKGLNTSFRWRRLIEFFEDMISSEYKISLDEAKLEEEISEAKAKLLSINTLIEETKHIESVNDQSYALTEALVIKSKCREIISEGEVKLKDYQNKAESIRNTNNKAHEMGYRNFNRFLTNNGLYRDNILKFSA